MRKKRKVIAVLVLALVIAGAVFLSRPARPAMPLYQGKTVGQWFGDLNTSNYNQAGLAFLAMGSNAIPFLIHELERTNSVWANFYARNWPKLPGFIRKQLSPPMADYALYWLAGTKLANLSLKAATPDLARLLSDRNPDRQFPILVALASVVGPEDTNCIPGLINCLQSTDEWVRLNAVRELNQITRDERVIPVLTNLMNSTNSVRRSQALENLREIDAKFAENYEISGQKKTSATNSRPDMRQK